ncbi:hypothetical protein OPV22_031186 [Ensete ventricosum]|uniref:Uncharacterized protein n=1 Tax=Ensete ventricosum TaxID=4639 RepID=A0AAV8P0A5_ENSVE|nr:hypothetical protein OPV22_031186 [Ensete ventricosum]
MKLHATRPVCILYCDNTLDGVRSYHTADKLYATEKFALSAVSLHNTLRAARQLLRDLDLKMELCMDEKWKLSAKGSRREAGRRSMAETFSRRWASLVKEQRSRFYIMRRCVVMLICWRDYS